MAKDAKVNLSDPAARAEIEAKRGIVRDGKGQIVFTAAQKKARIANFERKIADFEQRIKNAKEEIKLLKK